MKRILTKIICFASGVMLLASSCGGDATSSTNNKKEASHGIIMENMDTSVDPKNDFYNFVNGAWMKNTEIPDDQTSWGGFIATINNVLLLVIVGQE